MGGSHSALENLVKKHNKIVAEDKTKQTDEAALKLSRKHGLTLEETRKVVESAKNLEAASMILESIKPSVAGPKSNFDKDRMPEALDSQSGATKFFRQSMPNHKKVSKPQIVHEKVA